MKNISYFVRKELLESWRTWRLFILIIVFLILGIMNPLLAKFMPEIIKASFGSSLAVEIPVPTSIDSWTQFYKNMPQIGLIVIALMFSGIVNLEITQGTLVNLLTKGLNRSAVILGKFISLVLQWTLVFGITFSVTALYTLYYFPDDKSPHPLLAAFLLWIFGLFLSSLILFSSTLTRKSSEGLLLVGGGILVLLLLHFFEKTKTWNPLSLINENLAVLQKGKEFYIYGPAIMVSIFLSILFVGLSIIVMNKKKI